MPSTHNLVRRAVLTEPGEPLFVARSPIEAVIRHRSWIELTGMSSQDVLISDLVTIPLPIYPAQFPAGLRRWAQVDPAAMWHPLMWMPERLAHRYTVVTAEAPQGRLESDDEWALRVAIEMSVSGLYDTTSGTWLDMLSTVGLDVESESDLATVAAWLDGGPNDALDGIGLSEHLNVDPDPAWALRFAHTRIDALRTVAWATQADSLLEWCYEIADYAGSDYIDLPASHAIDDTSFASALSTLATIGLASFADIPAASDMADVDLGETAFWSAMRDRLTEPAADRLTDIATYLDVMTDRLVKIRERFWPAYVEIATQAT